MTSVTEALVAVGVAVVVVAAADLGLTVLHPSIRGPLSDRAEHLAWVTIRGLTRRGAGDRLLSFGGPAAMAADLLAWVLGLWFGFALIYAPYVHVFGYAHAGQAAHAGFTEALYLSGESLTTAGFGDVTAGGQALRLVTIGEAASGLALIAAAIAYLTAVHPRVSLVRAAAAWVSDRTCSAFRCCTTSTPAKRDSRSPACYGRRDWSARRCAGAWTARRCPSPASTAPPCTGRSSG